MTGQEMLRNSNMKGSNIFLLLLLSCIEVMGNDTVGTTAPDITVATFNMSTSANSTEPRRNESETTSTTTADSPTTSPSLSTSQSSPVTKTTYKTHPVTKSTLDSLFDRRILLMVSGFLIILCTVLLVTTVLLTWKVCQQKKYIRTDADLISTHEYWMGTAQRTVAQSETEAKQTSVLMSQLGQTPEETAKEEGGNVDKDETAVEGTPKDGKETGDAPKADQTPAGGTGTEEAPVAAAAATAAPPDAAVADASPPEGSERPKDVV
ncbi:uncharacterized protein ACJ7VT_006497 [Polymixia lowei]